MKTKYTLQILAFLSLLTFTLFWGCKKYDPPLENNKFDVDNAKEWWYGNFRKSASYTKIDSSSPVAPPKNTSSKKYPDWNGAIAYKKYNYEIVEVPLYHVTKIVLMPEILSSLTREEGERVSQSTISKLLLIKQRDGSIIVRNIMVIPSADFAKKVNYDLSDIHIDVLPPEFTGYLSITDWGMSLINFLKVENGKPTRRLNILRIGELPKQKKSSNKTEELICPPPVCVPDMMWVCAVVPTGDAVADHERCQEIGHWTPHPTLCTWQIPDCYEEEPDPLEVCMQSQSPENCYCMIMGIGCDPDPDPDPDPLPEIRNNVDDPCLKALVDEVISRDCQNEISNILQSEFGNSDLNNLLFVDNHYVGADARTSITYLFGPPERNNILINLNNNELNQSSEEYIAATILHEVMHAWIDYQFPVPIENAQQHNMMASTNRFNKLKDAILDLCPGLANNQQDLIDLTWGGLYTTIAFNNLPYADRERIVQTNLKYKNRINNTGTPCTQ